MFLGSEGPFYSGLLGQGPLGLCINTALRSIQWAYELSTQWVSVMSYQLTKLVGMC